MSTSPPAVIGLDVGGHGIQAVLVNEDGGLIRRASGTLDAEADRSLENVLRLCAELCAELRDGAAPGLPIGVGIPGFLDHERGLLHHSPNFPGWEGSLIGDRLSAALGGPVAVDNDANCALLGEIWTGAAKGARHVVLLTLGTGVGSAFLSAGRLIRGGRGAGAEGGHVPLYAGGRSCGCGQRGCLEAYASGPGLLQTAREEFDLDHPSGRFPVGDARQFFAQWKGDRPPKWAKRSARRFAEDLARGLVPLVHLFAPEVILLGGGVARSLSLFAPRLDHVLAARSIPACLGDALPVRACILGADAGAIGAARLALGSAPGGPVGHLAKGRLRV